MSRRLPWAFAPFAAACVVPAVLAAPPAAAAPKSLAGVWEGKVNVGAGLALTLGFRISEDGGPGGKPKATLSVPEQGAKDLPVPSTAITTAGDGATTVTFDLPNIRAKFVGRLAADGASIAGTFTQNGQSFPLTLTRKAAATELRRPQNPKPPFPYKSIAVSYDNPEAPGVKLAGTLTVPSEGAGPFPCAVLITGSGQQDRDETLLGHKPFLVIADYLTRRGIAVLRVDDRGVGGSTGGATLATATSADFAADVRAGLTFLKTRPEIDPRRVGLIGHSEGGLIAPLVAAACPDDVAFVVLLAGPGVPGDRILSEQSALIAAALGAPAAQVEASKPTNDRLFALIKDEADPAERKKKLTAFVEETVAKVPEASRAAARTQLTAQVETLGTPWFHYFFAHDPAPTLSQVRCPVLALNGGKDLQVPPRQSLPAIEAALKAGGNKDYTVKELPGLNHLFQTAKTGSPAEYAEIEETFSPDALKVMGDWVVAHTAKPKP